MLLWANKKEINMRIIEYIEIMYNDKLKIKNLRNYLKAWELSIIFKQIQKRFGTRKDISILDFGAGVSPFGAYLNHIGYKSITCLDLECGWHPGINQKTYNKKYNSHIRYIKKDIVKGFDGRYNVIFSASVLEHIEKNIRIKVIQRLSKHLKLGGLFIHVMDWNFNINIKELIDNCNLSISYDPEKTPGCKEYKEHPKDIWLKQEGKRKQLVSRIAFFNDEKKQL